VHEAGAENLLVMGPRLYPAITLWSVWYTLEEVGLAAMSTVQHRGAGVVAQG
jgi:hypothetical protein